MGGAYVPNTVFRNLSWDNQSPDWAIVQDFSLVQTGFQSPWATASLYPCVTPKGLYYVIHPVVHPSVSNYLCAQLLQKFSSEFDLFRTCQNKSP